MKKAICSSLMLISFAVGLLAQQGAEGLVTDGAAYLAGFFKNKFDVSVAIVRFENESELTDLALQKIYQMLVSRLEDEKNIRVSDLLIGFSNGRGEFNLSQAGALDYLLDLKLIQNKSKTGLGLTVYSRLQDRVVSVKYFEKAILQGEMDSLNARDFAFSELGFTKLLEFESKKDLMDIRSIAADDGTLHYFFYYPDEIIIYVAKETRLEKYFQFKLKWARPFYPALHHEGRLLLFRSGPALFLTAGNNSSPYALVFSMRDGLWQETQKLNFVPFQHVILNQNPYLVGARFEEGRNFFKDEIYFMPFSDPLEKSASYKKKVYSAMALDLSTRGGQLQAVHLIDRNYGYHLFTAEFEEKTPLPEKKGASLAALDGEWLAISDHSRDADQIFFYDIRDGGQRQAYIGKVAGEVQFISAGIWLGTGGFWAGVCQRTDGPERFMVQFWGKRNE